jgi:hypothetical protein
MAFIGFSYGEHVFQWDINIFRAKFQVKGFSFFTTNHRNIFRIYAVREKIPKIRVACCARDPYFRADLIHLRKPNIKSTFLQKENKNGRIAKKFCD